MSDFYWIIPDDAINYKGDKVAGRVVLIQTTSKAKAKEHAAKWRFDDGYEIYTPAEKVPFARFAFRKILAAATMEEVSNLLRTYKWQILDFESGDSREGDLTCLPSCLIKEAQKIVGNHSEPIDRYEKDGQVYTPPTGYYMFVNVKQGHALMIENHAKVYCSEPRALLEEEGESITNEEFKYLTTREDEQEQS